MTDLICPKKVRVGIVQTFCGGVLEFFGVVSKVLDSEYAPEPFKKHIIPTLLHYKLTYKCTKCGALYYLRLYEK